MSGCAAEQAPPEIIYMREQETIPLDDVAFCLRRFLCCRDRSPRGGAGDAARFDLHCSSRSWSQSGGLCRRGGPGHGGPVSSDGVTKTDVTLNNQSTVQGNVGVAATGNISTTGNAFISGTLFLNSAGSWSHSGTSSAGSFSQGAATDTKLNQAVQDALNASQQAAAQSSTQPGITSITLGDSGTQTIHGTGQDVLNLTTFNLGNNSVLTLDAPAGSSFILNISGVFTNQGQVVLTGGLTANAVLYNVVGTGQAIQFSGGGNRAQLSGILLSPQRDIQLAPGLVTGEIIGGGNILTLTSGADAVPEPSTVALAALAVAGWMGIGALRRVRGIR